MLLDTNLAFSSSALTFLSRSRGGDTPPPPTINNDSSSIDMSTPVTDNDSTGKRTAGSYAITDNSGSIDNGNSDPNFSTSINDGSILSSSDLASAIKNKIDSIIRNSIGGIIDKTPFLLPFH